VLVENGQHTKGNEKIKMKYKLLILSLAFSLALSVFSVKAETTWWNNSFTYRKALNLSENSGADLNNYTYNVTVDTATLISEGKLDSSCNCLAFTNSTGNGLLHAYIPPVSFERGATGCNVANTLVYVKLPNQTASTNATVYMYYNSTCGNVYTADPEAMLAWDDFTGSDGSSANSTRWNTIDTTGSCRINANQLACTNGAGSWNWAGIRSTWNYSINSPVGIYASSYMKIGTDDYMETALFMIDGVDPYTNLRSGVSIFYNQPSGVVQVAQIVSGTQTLLGSFSTTTTNYNENSLWANSTHFSFWTADTPKNSTTAYTGQPYAALVLSTSDDSGRVFWFDNVSARYIVYPEPTLFLGSEQINNNTNGTSIQLWLNNFQSNITFIYGSALNSTAAINVTGLFVELYKNGTLIANGTTTATDITQWDAGYYNITAYYPGNASFSASSTTWWANITKATPTCNLTSSSDWTYDYPSSTTITCSCTGEGAAHLYQNDTQHDEWNNTARIYENGIYSWICNITSGTNYSASSENKTLVIIVTNITKGTYINNSVSTIANTTTAINATTTSNTIVNLEIVTTSNITNSYVSVTEYNSTPSGITNLTSIGIYGLSSFFNINVSSNLDSSLSWVIINISYNESEVNDSNLDENSLRIYYYNSTLSNWTPFNPPYGGVNITANYVWANTTHFSYYGLGGLLSNGQSCNSNSDCSSGYCVHNVCRSSSPYCGDGYCDIGETSVNCPADCPPGASFGGAGGGWITPIEKKNVTEKVEEKPICVETWTCTDWSACQNGVETRICNDVNNCGTTDKKPILSQSCVVPPSIPSISPPTPATPLGLGVGLIAVIALSAIIIFIILKRKKIKKKTKFANMIP